VAWIVSGPSDSHPSIEEGTTSGDIPGRWPMGVRAVRQGWRLVLFPERE
jgi:hypothetical protein